MTDKQMFNTYNPTQEELIANAPEGATHYTEENEDWYLTYWKYDPLTDKWVHNTTNSPYWNDAYSHEFDELKAKGLVKSVEEGVLVESSEDDPISIRNRIIEIRKQRFDGIDEEEKLVKQLAALGFQVIEQVEKLDDIVVSDMDNPENWQEGDLFKIVPNPEDDHGFRGGKVVRFVKPDADGDTPYFGKFEYLDGSDWYWVAKESLKFHSRPSK
jgi:hypothetical protein